MNTEEKKATEAELAFWKARANRLRWALIDAGGASTLKIAKTIISQAIEFERLESERGGR